MPDQNEGGGLLLPPRQDTCQNCAVDHEAHLPHDKQSLYYQYLFRSERGRWPTWRDAMAHCEPEVRSAWEELLREHGAWDGWEGDTPPPPDVAPTPGRIGTLTRIKMEENDDA